MPKITVHGGPSYAGHTDTSPHDVAEPDWYVAASEPDVPTEPLPVVDEPVPAPGSRGRRRRS